MFSLSISCAISMRSATLLLLLYFLIVTDAQSGPQRIQMIPNVTEQVIEVNSTLTLTCFSEMDKHSNISWMLPDNLEKLPEVRSLLIEFDTF